MPNPSPPSPRISGASPVALAADLLSEFGAACCPSVSGFVERLIDRQANWGTRP